MPRRSVRGMTIAGALVLLAAAGCSSGSTAPPSASAAPTPAPAPGSSAESTTTAAPTTVPEPARWPLTGQVLADQTVPPGGVVAAKVDNSPDARPHAGINQADQVYELQVEGITRFMVLFNSQSPERIGPVRSARSSDIDLLTNLNRPLLAWSGGNPGVTGEVKGAEANGLLIDVSHSVAEPDYYRDGTGGKVAPHNLFTNVAALRAHHTPADQGPPLPMFGFRKDGAAFAASAVDSPGMTIDFGLNVRVDYVWDAERLCWGRFQVDQRHPRDKSAFLDEAGTQVCPENVVILFLEYIPDHIDSRSPRALSVGSGEGLVLTGGKAVGVRWERGSAIDSWHVTDANTAEPVDLTPGRTWVALPQQGADQVLPMDAAGAADLLKYRV